MRPARDVENEAIVRRAYCKRTLAVLTCSSAFIGILRKAFGEGQARGWPQTRPRAIPSALPANSFGSGWVIQYAGLPNTELLHWMVRG